MLLVAGCSFSVGGDDDAVGKASDVTVGECVAVSGDENAEKVEVRTVECSTEQLTFGVAAILDTAGPCANADYSLVTFEDGSQVCITPNFELDNCYQVPAAEGTTLADYALVDCTATPLAGTVIYQVTDEGTTALDCADGQLGVTYDLPEPSSYCVEKVSQA